MDAGVVRCSRERADTVLVPSESRQAPGGVSGLGDRCPPVSTQGRVRDSPGAAFANRDSPAFVQYPEGVRGGSSVDSLFRRRCEQPRAVTANATPRALRAWLSALAVLVLLLFGPRGAPAETVGHLVLKVTGNVNDIVVVDPRDRTDRDSAGVPHANIPGCARWPGGIDEDEESDSGAGTQAPERTVFQLDSVEFGRYVVSAHATRRVAVSLSVTFDSAVPGVPPCVDLTRSDRVGAGRHSWTIDVRRSPVTGECAVRIAPLPQGGSGAGQKKGSGGGRPPGPRR